MNSEQIFAAHAVLQAAETIRREAFLDEPEGTKFEEFARNNPLEKFLAIAFKRLQSIDEKIKHWGHF